MYLRIKPKANQILVITVSSCALFLVVWYFVVSCTLLNPSFYDFVFSSKPAQIAFTNASARLSAKGTTLFSSQSLKDNAYSLVEGILRFIRQKDMSLSNIQFETESTSSIRSVMMAAAPDEAAAVPEISRIHPFVMPYFIPGAENVFTVLLSVQKAFTALSTIIPVLGLIAMLLLFLHEKTAENLKAVLRYTGVAVMIPGVGLLLCYRRLLITNLSGFIPDAHTITPIVRQGAMCLMGFSFLTGALLILAASVFSVPAVHRTLNRFSKVIALSVLVLAGITFIVFSNDVLPNAVLTLKTQTESAKVRILKNEDGAVHSLTIKLRKTDTQEPIKNVRLTLLRMDSLSEPSRITTLSDVQGDARFVLPKGKYLLTADPSTVPVDSSHFEPVMLTLDKPDSSWYTFYLSNSSENSINLEIPDDRNLGFSNHPVPLLK